MVDITHDENTMNNEDFEDGELPEDGEICDDEEEAPKEAPKSSTSAEPIENHRESRDRERERDRDRNDHRERERERERNPRDRDTRTRRFEEPPVRDLDPFGPSSDDGPTNEYFNSGADKDYRSNEDERFNDCDYRVNRRRRHSPSLDDQDYDSRSKRPFHGRGGFRGGFRGGQKPRFNTEHQICKFFREGYCRDGDNCSYSHSAEDSLRRPVLCNFYANSFCKKGLQCLMLHGEYPCIEFHKGTCQNEQCRFSHIPLTDYTKPMFEKALEDEEKMNQRAHNMQQYRQNPVANAAAAAAAAALPSRRRVLLPGGPPPQALSPPQAVIHAPIPQHNNNGQLPPPSVVVPTIQRPVYQQGGFFNTAPVPMQQVLPPPRTIEPPVPVSKVQKEKIEDPPVFNLEAMLNKLAKGEGLDSDDDDSPASPPQMGYTTSQSVTKIIPEHATIPWRLVEIIKLPAYSGVEDVDNIPSNDPRKARAMTQQFDAFSSMLGGGNANNDVGSDPRIRLASSAYDPGLMYQRKPQSSAPISSWMPQIS